MKKHFVTFLFLLNIFSGAAQTKIEFRLKSITKIDKETYEPDTSNLITPKTIQLTANPLSPVTAIARINDYNIGIQVEVLQSHLQNTPHIVLGLVIYKKKNGPGNWEFLSRTDHWPVYDSSGNLASKGEQMASLGFVLNEDDREEFDFLYQLRVY